MFMKHYAPNRYEPRIEAAIVKMPNKSGGGGGGGGVHGGCEPRISYCENAKKIVFSYQYAVEAVLTCTHDICFE